MHKKRVGSDDPVLGRIIRTWVGRRHACGMWRRSGKEASGKRAGKVEGSPGNRFLGSGARRNGRREQIDGGPKLRAPPMVNG